MPQDSSVSPALKEIFNAAAIRDIGGRVQAVYPAFDKKAFVRQALEGLPALSLLARLRRVTEALHARMPSDYRTSLGVLRDLAPTLPGGFVTMILPDYVALYGLEDFAASMDALAFFTAFGSSEFGVRPFLLQDLTRSLAVMERWSRSKDEHVRRLASEGSRPRLPWSFRIKALMADPQRLAPILDNLRDDPSLYVRRSVANSLNDITKDNPAWTLARVEGWSLESPRTAWIVRHALRSLIKKGDRRALTVMGAGDEAQVKLSKLEVEPRVLTLGQTLEISFELRSTSARSQRLVVDYAVHYVKKSGAVSAKVFKLKTLALAPHANQALRCRQLVQDFTTRVHYEGRHDVDILVNGLALARTAFVLKR